MSYKEVTTSVSDCYSDESIVESMFNIEKDYEKELYDALPLPSKEMFFDEPSVKRKRNEECQVDDVLNEHHFISSDVIKYRSSALPSYQVLNLSRSELQFLQPHCMSLPTHLSSSVGAVDQIQYNSILQSESCVPNLSGLWQSDEISAFLSHDCEESNDNKNSNRSSSSPVTETILDKPLLVDPLSATRQRPGDLSERLAEILRTVPKKSSTQRLPPVSSLVVSRSISVSNAVSGITKSGEKYEAQSQPSRNISKGVRNLVSPELVLRSRLLDLAESVAVGDEDKSRFLQSLLQSEANPGGSVMQRIVWYFLEGLTARLQGGMTAQEYLKPLQVNQTMMKLFEETTRKVPCLFFHSGFLAEVVADAVSESPLVHIVTLHLWSNQWGPLLKTLAQRKAGAPMIRLTAVEAPPGTPFGCGPVVPAGVIMMEIRMAAAEAGVQCEFACVTSRLEDLNPEVLGLDPKEALVVAATMRLQQLPDGTVLRSNPRDTFLQKVRLWNPKVFVISGINTEQNTPFFLSRLRESVDFHTVLFQLFDSVLGRTSKARQMFEKTIWGREIKHSVASEGSERVQREERVCKWQERMQRCGFKEFSLNPSGLYRMVQAVKGYHADFDIQLSDQALMLTWKDRPIMAGHAWMC